MAEKDLKVKKKRWLSIFSSKDFNNFRIGESYVEYPEQLQNKHLTLNLAFLLNDPKKQNYTLTFKVTEVRGETGVADPVQYGMVQSSVKRLIRKGVGKIEDSFIATSKDQSKFVIKPVLITRHQMHASVRTALRKKTRAFVTEMMQTMDMKDVFQHIIANKLQMDLKSQLRPICPVSIAEIRVLKRL